MRNREGKRVAVIVNDMSDVNIDAVRNDIQKLWREPSGDRRQELVFIGIGLHERSFRQRLERCLLTDRELRGGPSSWRTLADPFPQWQLGH